MDKAETELSKPYSDEIRVSSLRLGKAFVYGEVDRIYYPGSHLDISPSEAFPESLVHYTDLDFQAMHSLRNAGYDAECFNANGIILIEKVDAIVIYNSGVDPTIACQSLRIGGCLFCNNYYHTGYEAHAIESLQHVASIAKFGSLVIVDDDVNHLSEYWEQIDTEEAFIAQDTLEQFRDLVQRFCGRNREYLSHYRELYSRSIPGSIRYELSTIIDPPEYGSDGFSPETYGGIVFAEPGDHSTYLPGIPMKRGHADTTFVFRKVR
jgi:hypothetical protein